MTRRKATILAAAWIALSVWQMGCFRAMWRHDNEGLVFDLQEYRADAVAAVFVGSFGPLATPFCIGIAGAGSYGWIAPWSAAFWTERRDS